MQGSSFLSDRDYSTWRGVNPCLPAVEFIVSEPQFATQLEPSLALAPRSQPPPLLLHDSSLPLLSGLFPDDPFLQFAPAPSYPVLNSDCVQDLYEDINCVLCPLIWTGGGPGRRGWVWTALLARRPGAGGGNCWVKIPLWNSF